MKKFLSAIGGFAAFLTVIMYLLVYLNSAFGSFLPTDIANIMVGIKEYAALLVVAVTGLEFTWGRKKFNIITFVYLGVVAIIVIFMFFPGALSTVGL